MYIGHVFAVGWLSMLQRKIGKCVIESPDFFFPDTKLKFLVLQMCNLHKKKRPTFLIFVLVQFLVLTLRKLSSLVLFARC